MKIKHFLMCAVAAVAITACGNSNNDSNTSKDSNTISAKLDEVETLVDQMEEAANDGDLDKLLELSQKVSALGDEISKIEAVTPSTQEEQARALELMNRMYEIAQ